MPRIKSVDAFIERSLSLLEAHPETTVSITYGDNLKKIKKEANPDESSRISNNFVSFKTYDPTSGACYKIIVYKTKELSRMLTFLGPRGVQATKTRKAADSDDQPKKKQKTESYIEHKTGLSSIMTNNEFVEEEEVVESKTESINATPEPTSSKPAPTGISGKAKKGKKKGKK